MKVTHIQAQLSENLAAYMKGDPFKICSDLYASNASNMHFYKAIVCGIAPPTSQYEFLKTLGLWHLLIISAGHWIVLEQLLEIIKLKKNKSLFSFVFLFILSGINTPIIRSALERVFKKMNHYFQLQVFKSENMAIASGVTFISFSLLNIPVASSVLASWNLALALEISRIHFKGLKRMLFTQFLMTPSALFFGQNLLISAIGNILLGPLLSYFLFPLSLLAPFFPFQIDPTIKLFLDLAEHLSILMMKIFPSQTSKVLLSQQFLFFWNLIFSFILFSTESKGKKQ